MINILENTVAYFYIVSTKEKVNLVALKRSYLRLLSSELSR